VSFNCRTIEIRKREAGIAWFVLDRPDRRNPMSPEPPAECGDALETPGLDEFPAR
jgi:enoyl-CoA hydratase/carnithine racemase